MLGDILLEFHIFFFNADTFFYDDDEDDEETDWEKKIKRNALA